MKTRFIALNLLLLASIGAVIWQARVRWNDARQERISALAAKPKPGSAPPLSAEPKPDAPLATKYVDVAEKNLFSKDRNPTVVIEPPPVENPKIMPHLPIVYGVLGLPGGTRALMAERADAPSKPVRAGDTIGEFKIASLDPQTVVFNWEGKDISRKIEDLMDRSSHGAQAGGAPAASPAANGPAAPPPPPSNPQPPAPSRPGFGAEVGSPGHSERLCQPGDAAPAGAIVEGYRKVVVATPFGPTCRWVSGQ